MRASTIRTFLLAACACALGGWGILQLVTPPPKAVPAIPAAALSPAAAVDNNTELGIRFWTGRVERDPTDFIALNKLAGYHLQHLRETGNLEDLQRARKAIDASLAARSATYNSGALAALAQIEYASHDFAAARDHALQWMRLEPHQAAPYAALGDALLELGQYEKAESAYKEMEQRSQEEGYLTRRARLAELHGSPDAARELVADALDAAVHMSVPPRETVAWCRWQLGELAFSTGDYPEAERRYREALKSFPTYYRALASLGRVRAARGDQAGAISQYEHATRIMPDPLFLAALGDLYRMHGRKEEAEAQYALVEQIGHLNAVNGTLYNRSLALFHADHDRNVQAAYEDAKREYGVRRDIYGADALAWTALKAGRVAEAQAASRDALRLGTKDARLLYHAGMIARAAGDARAAHDYLGRALALNPQFDPLQASLARQALGQRTASR